MATQNEITVLNADKIATMTQYSREEVAVVKATVAKGTTDTELAYFLSICRSAGLNPMLKEIWCYKDSKGNLLVFAGRDGFLKKGQESPRWNGMTSMPVFENDFFEMNITDKKVDITHKPNFKDKGKLLGAYAIVSPKDCEYPTVEWAENSVYNKGYNTWKDNAPAMILKVAETHALKKAFGITGLQSEYDFEVKDNIVVPVQVIEPESELKTLEAEVIELIDKLPDLEDQAFKKNLLIEKRKAGELTVEFLAKFIEKLKK
jgi:hypothetical protein